MPKSFHANRRPLVFRNMFFILTLLTSWPSTKTFIKIIYITSATLLSVSVSLSCSNEEKRMYASRVMEVEHATFTP